MSFHLKYNGAKPEEVGLYQDLSGNSTEDINLYSGIIVASVVGVTVMGAVVDAWHPPWLSELMASGRPRAWLTCLLTASYSLLIPGLACVLFSFDVVITAFGAHIFVRPEDTDGPVTESMLSVVSLMKRTGSWTGATLVVLYSMIIPAAKLAALVAVEFWRRSKEANLILRAQRLVSFVQLISKWACPDMFAYILLQHLIRGLHHPPIVQAGARLDVGFACFSVFCICSTISSLGIRVPLGEATGARSCTSSPNPGSYTPVTVEGRRIEVLRGWLGVLAAAISALSLVLLWTGLQSPCMALQVQTAMLYSDRGGPLRTSLKPIVDRMVAAMLNDDVSVLECLQALWRWIGEGEAISVFGFVLYAVFVIAMTMLDLVVLVAAAFGFRRGQALAAARMIKKLSMLDVFIMGVVVVSFCGSIYEEEGIVISLRIGLLELLGAEAAHYVCYYLVTGLLEGADVVEEQFERVSCQAEDPLCM